jgi:hypothetical protein
MTQSNKGHSEVAKGLRVARLERKEFTKMFHGLRMRALVKALIGLIEERVSLAGARPVDRRRRLEF